MEIEKEDKDQAVDAQARRRNAGGDVYGCNLACSLKNLWDVGDGFDAECMEVSADAQIKVVEGSRRDRRLLLWVVNVFRGGEAT